MPSALSRYVPVGTKLSGDITFIVMGRNGYSSFKEYFLLIYNRMTENCFNHCALLFSDRERSENEVKCVDVCAQKHINVNHKIMQMYMDVQPEFIERKIQEANRIQQEMADAQTDTHKESQPVPNTS